MPKLVIPTDEEIQAFFFEAMLHGWVSENPINIVKKEPNETVFTFSKENLFLRDQYYTSPSSNFSAGKTLVRVGGLTLSGGITVWIMQYQGAYNKESIPFLKKVLHDAYMSKMFFGGRGPQIFRKKGFVYTNRVQNADFGRFYGSEEIFWEGDIHPRTMGWHDYMGMSLT